MSRRILITGGGRGLGAALAQTLARSGHSVWVVARTESELQETVDSAPDAAPMMYTVCNVASESDLTTLAHQVEVEWGTLDFLINNAGKWIEGPIEECRPSDLADLVATNLLAPILVTRAFMGLLRRGVSPTIVNIASSSSTKPSPGWPAYAATKYGLRGFTESLLGHTGAEDIRCLLVNPGGIDTEMYVRAGYTDKHKQPWMMDPHDVAASIAVSLLESGSSASSRLDISKVISHTDSPHQGT